MKQSELIHKCINNERKAQKELYERFGPLMKAVCRRYLFQKELAEEVMNRGFLKVFTNLKEFRGDGSFEGWVRRIMVRESLNENKRKHPTLETNAEHETAFLKIPSPTHSQHDADYILKLIDALPIGYKTVFNMNEIEGYSHAEIAKELGITESASRSQLARAKKLLREKLERKTA